MNQTYLPEEYDIFNKYLQNNAEEAYNLFNVLKALLDLEDYYFDFSNYPSYEGVINAIAFAHICEFYFACTQDYYKHEDFNEFIDSLNIKSILEELEIEFNDDLYEKVWNDMLVAEKRICSEIAIVLHNDKDRILNLFSYLINDVAYEKEFGIFEFLDNYFK